ncbi:thiol-disulfide oxidoreductase DCC family protein [Streptomonospora nanhaiensis]|uniref:Putative DCC family thiol-disulfide oxidoreductase YuxK n=1 Tax=Streptomonospora nanhaiensis TaxID=1323731 RepID=A0A853BSQ2_9ACTN|nr:DUF393 domain-containing protein [Streptomonospora nanhaiensis]MBV2364855.1 DUF393 domain-containing protein [Streptomonospora nanhaiensis]MBX9387177.1 DUF393 domain-containing protein [Streptomonospora nanhaiensis]NYI98799.1 putative DCC family thiol-disulfide oxidoreductase YuxK [Streptomonospora nanhaiensis]
MSRPVLVFDGDCGFCTDCARLARDRVAPGVDIVPWQRAGLPPGTAERARHEVLLRDAAGRRVWGGVDAVAVLLLASPRPWWPAAGWLLRRAPVRALGAAAYRWVARNRHRMPGGTPACALGPPT